MAARALGSAVVAVLLASLLAAPASAATFSETFCQSGTAAGQCEGPAGVAVDQSGGPGGAGGTVYVADVNNRRIDAFDSAGHFLMAFGLGVATGAAEIQTCTIVCGRSPESGAFKPTGIAVDQSTHDLYVAEPGNAEKFAFDPLTQQFEFLLSFGGGVLDGGATGSGDLTAGSTEVTNLATTSRRFRIGQTIAGSGIPAGTRIVEVPFVEAAPGSKIVLSQSATATAKGVLLTAPTPAANNSNNEIQTVTLGGSPSGGAFQLAGVGGPFTASTSSGSPNLTSASSIVAGAELKAGSNVIVLHGVRKNGVRDGQVIAGPGIPAGATIIEVDANGGSGTVISANATLTTTVDIDISVTAHGTGNLASGSNVVTSVANVGEFVAGQTIAGAGIPVGATITTVSEAEGKLTLSVNVTGSATGVALTATVKPPLSAGEGIAGAGIPVGATIVSFTTSGDPIISTNTTISASGASLQSGIPFNASSATVRSLLESALGAGNVEVTGPAGGPWEVEFKGRDADIHVGLVNGDGSRLTPSGKVEVQTIVGGASAFEICTKAEVSEGDLCLPGVGGSGAGQIGPGRAPLAVDPTTHDVWVGGLDRIEEFGEAGEYLSEVKLPGAGEVVALAVDSAGDFYVRSGGNLHKNGKIENDVPGVRKYDSAGNPVPGWGEGGAVDASGHPVALTLDPASGDLYVGDCPEYERGDGLCQGYSLLRFDASGAQTLAYGAGEVTGDPFGNALAFGDVAQRLYTSSSAGAQLSAGQIFTLPPPGPLVENGSAAASAVRKQTATLNAGVDPEGKATTYRFQYIAEQQFAKNEEEGREAFAGAEETAPSSSIGEDFSFHHASVPLTGLLPATAYRFRVIAFNSNNAKGVDGETASFETLPPASVDASVAEVTATSVTLIAQINPLGDETSYRFQYIASEAMQRNEEAGEPPFTGASQAPAAEVAIGSGEEPVSVFQHVQGLSPHTSYRYRVVVTNAAAPAGFASPTLAFTTQSPAAAPALPDGRQWELVSPPDKHGALLIPIEQEGLIQAAASGEGISYIATIPTENEPQGFSQASQVLSARGAIGWSSRDLPASHPRAVGLTVGGGYEYRFFSLDLSLGVLQPVGPFEPALSPEATEQTPYLRKGVGTEGSVLCTESCYLPLLTSEDVTSGANFGTCAKGALVCGAAFVGASSDLSHVALTSDVGLTSTPGDKGGLYEYSRGQLALVSVLPGGAPAKPETGPALGFKDQIARGAVSADGSRVFWSETGGGQPHLYLRDLAKGETLELDLVQSGSGSGSPQPIFQFASEDGSRVFFTDTQPLTSDSGASSAGADLYECRIEEQAGHLRCALTDLTPVVAGENGDPVGTMTGASEDGAYAYFVADGDLAGSEANEHGERAHRGQPNLYLRHEGATVFLATLANEDNADWAQLESQLTGLTARVSPNGLWFAFMSSRSLTGYDNRDAASGQRDEEVFLYHATGNKGKGKLVCASCNPTGARPHGVEYGEVIEPHMKLTGGNRVWKGNQWIAANIPGWTPYESSRALYQSRYLSDSGRLFFNSHDALVPQDTNGTEDVYEYEAPRGEGALPSDGCGESDPTYDPAAAGCIALISSGASPEESAFIDASETGDDVFFLTNSRLTPLDFDGALDVYDAHVCTTESPCPPPPPPPPPNCQGDACQAPAVPPIALTPGSLTFSGAGNAVPTTTAVVAPKVKPATRAQKLARALRACRKKKAKRRRTVCEKQAKRTYGVSAKLNMSSKKGAGR